MKCPQHNEMEYKNGYWICKHLHCGTIVKGEEKMNCPLCQQNIKPDYVFQLNAQETKEKMKEDYNNLDHLGRHLLWGHAQKDVVTLLMEYMKKYSA